MTNQLNLSLRRYHNTVMFFLKILLVFVSINVLQSRVVPTETSGCNCSKKTIICLNSTKLPKKCANLVNKLELYNLNSATLLKNSATFRSNIVKLSIYNSSLIFSGRKRQHVTLLPQITYLKIESNVRLTRFPVDFFQQFLFENLTTLNFIDNNLQTIPESSFKYIQKIKSLNLSSNNLKQLNKSQFELLNELQYLNISDNQIDNLHESCFSNLPNLFVLDLSSNKLYNLNNAINLLPNLNKLLLDNNRITDKIRIVTNRYLLHLHLVNTSLTTVPKSIMTHSVVYFNMSSNLIETLTEEDFDSVPLLRVLDLSRNLIRAIEPDTLGRLDLLEELYLAHNLLTTITPNLPSILRLVDFGYNNISQITLLNLESLETLKLSWNPIEKLPENLLINLKKLKNLQLSGLRTNESLMPVPDTNSITSLDLNSSPNLADEFLQNEAIQIAYKSVTDLNLSFNAIKQLPTTMLFEYLSELKSLQLDGNEILCDSLLNSTELMKWLKFRASNKMQIRCLLTHRSKSVALIDFYVSQSLPIMMKHQQTVRDTFPISLFATIVLMGATLVFSLVLIYLAKKWRLAQSRRQHSEREFHLTEFDDLW